MKCVVCSKASKYRCPTCNVNYCSSEHYKSHNLFCTETFYKSQVESNLKDTKSTPKEAQRMRRILHSQPPELSLSATERYEQILESLDHNEEVVLTHQEEERLAEFLKNWSLEEGHPQFWELEQGLSLYHLCEVGGTSEEIDEDPEEEIVGYRRLLKGLIDSIPPTSALCVSPNPTVIYHVYSLVFAGCVVFRYYDGDIASVPSQSSSLLLKLSGIQQKTEIETIHYAHYLLQSACPKELRPWLPLSKMDCMRVFKNRYLVLQMLLRLKDVIPKKKVNKKIDFYCSYIKALDLKSISEEIHECCQQQQDQQEGRDTFQQYRELFKAK